MLIFSYLLGISFKIYNSYKYIQYEILIEAQQKEMTTEEIMKERYFDFFWNQLPMTERNNNSLFNCLFFQCKWNSVPKCCSKDDKDTSGLQIGIDGMQRGGIKYSAMNNNKNKKRWRSCLNECNNPLFQYITSANYLMLLVMIIQWGFEEEDN